jgi:hypothetical protein
MLVLFTAFAYSGLALREAKQMFFSHIRRSALSIVRNLSARVYYVPEKLSA